MVSSRRGLSSVISSLVESEAADDDSDRDKGGDDVKIKLLAVGWGGEVGRDELRGKAGDQGRGRVEEFGGFRDL